MTHTRLALFTMEPINCTNLPDIANSTPQVLLAWWTNATAKNCKALVLSAPSLITTNHLCLDNTDLDWAGGVYQACLFAAEVFACMLTNHPVPAGQGTFIHTINKVTAANAHITSLQAALKKLKPHSSQHARPGDKQALDILGKFPCYYMGPGHETIKFPPTGGKKWADSVEYLSHIKQLANSVHEPIVKYLQLNYSYHSEALKEIFNDAPDNMELDKLVLKLLKVCNPH